jgi:hypothetical protein
MLRRWLRSKYFAGRRVNISSGVPAVLLESTSPPAFLTADAELAAQQKAAKEKSKMVCFICGLAGHKKANCPTMVGGKSEGASSTAALQPSVAAVSHDANTSGDGATAAECEAAGNECDGQQDDLRNSTMALWDMPYDLQVTCDV